MASASASPLRLGLVGGPQPSGSPPLAILAERAGWESLWLPADQPSPAPSEISAMRVGWIVDPGAIPGRSMTAVWIRGSLASFGAAEWSTLRTRVTHISVDAATSGAANAIEIAGALPVFGPGHLDDLLPLLDSVGGHAAVYLPASPGRTNAESQARLDADPELRIEAIRAPGLIGTLEHCQRTVAALYLAGVRELRLRLPATPDIPDVIAQVAALRADALARLEPGSPQSPAPAAPPGWGGRR
jgi:hypothetical protein